MAGEFKIKNAHLLPLGVYRIKNWLDYCLDLFDLTKKKNIVYTMRDGLKYYARTRTTDRAIINTVSIEDEYGIRNMKLSNATIIDIGGQNGYFSIFASKYASQIYVYEPVLSNFLILLKNIELNHLENMIHPFNLAVSDKLERVKIFLSRSNTGGHSIYGSGQDYIESNAITLSAIFEQNNIENCDLLKMDIEGAEYNILYNAPDEYLKKIKNIRMEVHHLDHEKRNHNVLTQFLRNKQFEVYFKRPILFAHRIE